ncbi:hypothetical protein Q5752_001264 [Cryptotrichosporon argae]
MRASLPRLFRLSAPARAAPPPTQQAASAASSAAESAASALKSAQANPQVQRAVDGASKAYEQGAAAVRRVAGPVGDRVGSMLGAYRAPLTYNAKVFASLLRQVYVRESLAFPTSLSTWAHAYASLWARGTSPAFWRGALQSGAWAGLAVGAVEAYGIFKIGEILGRRHLVGYKLQEH